MNKVESEDEVSKADNKTHLFGDIVMENVHHMVKVLNLETNYSLNDRFARDLDSVYKDFVDRLPVELKTLTGQKLNSIIDFNYVSSDRVYILCYSSESYTELRLYDDSFLKAKESKKLSDDCLTCLLVSESLNLVLVSGGLFENKIFVLNAETIEEIKILSTNKQVKSIAQCFNKGVFFSLQNDNGVFEWDLGNLGKFSVVTSENFECLSVSKNTGLVVVATSYGKIEVYEGEKKIEVKETIKIKGVLVSDFGEYLAVDSQNSVFVYKINEKSMEMIYSKEFEGVIKDLLFIKDNILVVVLKNGTIYIIDFCVYRQLIKLSIDKVKRIQSINDEYFMALVDLKLYTVKIPDLLKSFKIDNCSFTALSIQNKCAYVVRKTQLNELDLKTEVHRELFKTSKDIQKLHYIDDERLIISVSGSMILFDTLAQKILIDKPIDDEFIYIFKVNYIKNQLFTGGSKKIIRIYDLNTLEKTMEFGKHTTNITHIISFTDWSKLITREINYIRIFDLTSYKEIHVIEKKSLNITLTPDNRRLFIQNKFIIQIYELSSNTIIHEMNHRGTLISGLYFTKNQKMFITLTSDSFLRFWDFNTLTLVFEIPTAGSPDHFKVSEDEEFFLIRSDIKYKTILLIKNPLLSRQTHFFGPTLDYFGFLKYFCDIKNRKPVTYQEDFDKSIILPHCLTYTHLFSYQGMSTQLKQCLLYNPVFSTLPLNYSPLDISLVLNHKNVVLVFLKYLTKKIQEFPFIGNSINQKNLVKLNLLGFDTLTDFYNALLYVNPFPDFPKIVKNSAYLPKVRKNQSFLPNLHLFDVTPADEGISVEFVTSLVQLNITSGSKESIAFLSSLLRCTYTDIFRSTFIQMLINYKWKYIFLVTVSECILFVVYMFLLSAVSLTSDSLGTLIVFFIFGFILTTYEALQILGGIKVYLKDFWNFVDITRSSLMILYLDCIIYNRSYTSTTLLLLNLVSWVRGISYFRIFSKTRYMINLITEVCKDVASFLIILAYSTIAFSFILMLMVDNHTRYFDYFQLSYLITLGNINTVDYNTIQWVCFIITTIINPIIMINLLISIMGDTHDKVQENKEVAEYKELTSLIFEVEVASIFRRNNSVYERFHICQEIVTKGLATTWMGKVREIKTMINSLKFNQIKTNEINTQILNENIKLKEQLGRVEKMIVNIKEKLTVENFEANDFEVSCQKGHKLSKSYHYESIVKCHKCGSLNEIGFSCGICSYFVCKGCYKSVLTEKVAASEFSCFRDHKVVWLSDNLQYKNKMKVFLCAGCKKGMYKNSFNCDKCSWDICRKCVEIVFTKSGQAWSVHCDNNHSLSWVKKGHPNYMCNKCKNLFSNIGSFMCLNCNYDICIRCLSMELGK